MIEYPFSGMIPNLDPSIPAAVNDKTQVHNLITRYCRTYGVDPSTLTRNNKLRSPKRVFNGVHVDYMRISLGKYIYENFGLTLKQVAVLIGYQDHSTISSQREKVNHYIKTKDPYFYPYWETLLKIA
jgi:chromosomal replication initiation ATPase DnaA